MKIFLICSKHCYGLIEPISEELKKLGHDVEFPNCFNNPKEEDENRKTEDTHRAWKRIMFKESAEHIANNDAVLVLNMTIPIRPTNYIGGATFLEMYEAFRQNKKIFVYNELPVCSHTDELNGLTTKVIYGNLSDIK